MTPAAPGPAALIDLRGVTAGYEGSRVLHDVDLSVTAGDFVAVVGPSGSGKTTLLKVLLGSLRPAAGSVTRARRLRIGYVPQLETVNWDFPVTVTECVLMASGERSWPWSTRAEKRRVHELLDRLGIAELAGRHIRELSGGQQQRMFLARALQREPQVVLLDEPTSGVDVATRHDMLHLLQELNSALRDQPGTAILLTTHDLNGVAAHVPEVVALHGHVVARGAPREVMTGPVLAETFGAPMEVLEHLGMPVVLDHGPRHHRSAPLGKVPGE